MSLFRRRRRGTNGGLDVAVLQEATLRTLSGESYASIERDLGVTDADLRAFQARPVDPSLLEEARASWDARIHELGSDDVRREMAMWLLDSSDEEILYVSLPAPDDETTAGCGVSFSDGASIATFDDLVEGSLRIVAEWPGVRHVERTDTEYFEVTGSHVDTAALELRLRTWWMQQLRSILDH